MQSSLIDMKVGQNLEDVQSGFTSVLNVTLPSQRLKLQSQVGPHSGF